jgi:hypothetical protein
MLYIFSFDPEISQARRYTVGVIQQEEIILVGRDLAPKYFHIRLHVCASLAVVYQHTRHSRWDPLTCETTCCMQLNCSAHNWERRRSEGKFTVSYRFCSNAYLAPVSFAGVTMLQSSYLSTQSLSAEGKITLKNCKVKVKLSLCLTN